MKHDKKVTKIAVAHMSINKDVKKNSTAIQALLRQASDEHCRLVQFPEGALSGYCKTQITSWEGYDWNELEIQLNKIQRLARTLNIWAIVGSTTFIDDKTLPRNSLIVVSDKGEVMVRYDKRFISHGELQGWYSPGKSAVTFEVDELKFGLALCLEVQFPEVFDEYYQQNVDAVLLSAYANDPMFEITARAYANLYNYWIGFSVPSNQEPPLTSSLIGPDGYVQDISKKTVDSLAIGEINIGDERWDVPLNKAKPWRKLARQGDIYI